MDQAIVLDTKLSSVALQRNHAIIVIKVFETNTKYELLSSICRKTFGFETNKYMDQ